MKIWATPGASAPAGISARHAVWPVKNGVSAPFSTGRMRLFTPSAPISRSASGGSATSWPSSIRAPASRAACSSSASSRLVLNQLTFGEPVEGAPNSLPVKLAVALLADRQGVIDLQLPISGSLNDPQFSIGPVIFKIIVNLIGKAITAPFSLLASAFGGGDEMSNVPFAPGSATLTPEAQQSLDKVAKALADRPALKITVTGMASLQDEREGLQREHLRQLVLAEKRRANPADTAPVSAAEYPALLKEVYRRADIPKPRNLVGLAKDLSVPEMEALLLANQPATEAMAADLATQRGQAIRAYLVSQKLPVERLFVAAPKSGKQPEKWTPRADLSLATQ